MLCRTVGKLGPSSLECPEAEQPVPKRPAQFREATPHVVTRSFFLLDTDTDLELRLDIGAATVIVLY